MSWYDDMDRMERDDEYLQRVFRSLQCDLSEEGRRRTRTVHVYPSLRCSYTIAKQRIFIKVRDDQGAFLPECVLRHVLLHELAHTLNGTHGHDASFRGWVRWLSRGIRGTCAGLVPRRYNPCH